MCLSKGVDFFFFCSYFDILVFSVQLTMVIPNPVMELHTLEELRNFYRWFVLFPPFPFSLSCLDFLIKKAFFFLFIHDLKRGGFYMF